MYDFDSLVERRSAYASKWQVADGELPLTTADMDFQTAPEIAAALRARLERGALGYTDIPEAWARSYQDWWQRRHGLRIETDQLVYTTGVVAALSSAVRKLTTVNENVALLTPVYNIFFNCIVNNGRRPLEVPLKIRADGCDIDFDGLEAALAQPQTTLLFFCNPHNPTGRIWTREELARVGELCQKHHVVVVSDEIHCDLTEPGRDYVPFAWVNEVCRMNSVTCLAPTKTFNLAGLQTAAVYAANDTLRHKMWREINTSECGEPNAFAVDAVLAAFGQGEAWLNELRAYLAENKRLIRERIAQRCPKLRVLPSEATYLLWIDARRLCPDAERLSAYIQQATGLILTPGDVYGKGGEGWLRMNTAYPRSVIEDALNRLEKAVSEFQE